ncbi:polyprotein [Sesbania bispinosa]|nr:polyprotein [Sesbania bispinosa]
MTRANVTVPKVIRWEDIVLPDKWTMDRATPTIPRKTQEIQQIRQFETGKVEIIFDRRNSFSSRSEASRIQILLLQEDHSQLHPNRVYLNLFTYPLNSISEEYIQLQPFPRTTYHKDEEEDQRSIQSPTYSSLNDNYDVIS